MARSKSVEEDKQREEVTPSRVIKVHGGQTVESIAPEDLVSFNDADCKHEKLIRDPSETEFNAFMCSNPECNEVVLFQKSK